MKILILWVVFSSLLLIGLLLIAEWVGLDISLGEAAIGGMVASAVILWIINSGE
ncbi:MAG: hypothetical protein OXE50_14520 [Chloroflexi bacterium]|nr:hypothetical protein [Chloroflexota bacterium]